MSTGRESRPPTVGGLPQASPAYRHATFHANTPADVEPGLCPALSQAQNLQHKKAQSQEGL